MRTRTAATVVCAGALLLAACGDADTESASAEEYCQLAAQLNAAEQEPTEEQLDQIVDLAPAEIRDEVETLVVALRTGEFTDQVREAEADLTDWEEENCGRDLAGGGGEEGDGQSGAPAVVTFESPRNGDTVSNPVIVEPNVVRATIAPAAESGPGEGHYHVMIDTECLPSGDTIPSDAQHVHFGDGRTTLDLPPLEPGEHTLCLQLGDGQHRAFGAASTITIQVEG